MPALQVKDFPSDVYDDLRQCAAQEDRSIAQQTVHILKRYLALYKAASRTSANPDAMVFNAVEDEAAARIKQREEVLRRIAELPPLDLSPGFESTADFIREDRDGRFTLTDEFIVKTIREGREERTAFVDEMIEEMRNDRS